MTWQLFWLLIAVTGAFLAGFIPGHKLGRWSCRSDYPKGWDQGQQAERERWEQATGTTWDALAAWQSRRDPEPGLEGGWQEPPPTDVLMAEAVRQGYTERVPSVADPKWVDAQLDDLAARWEAAQAGADSHVRTGASAPGWPGAERYGSHPSPAQKPPVFADLTGPDAWHYPGEDDVPTLTGLIVTSPRRTGPEWLEAQLAAMDSDTDAYLRRMKAEIALSRRGITTGART